MVPSTRTDFAAIEAALGAEPSGTSVSTSFEPDTRSVVFPFTSATVPAMVAVDSFIVKPFFATASFNCLSVTVFPGFIFTAASPFSRLTLTESTPETPLKDTLTACAQTSQSMPKIVMSIDLISADAEAASNKSKVTSFLI
jgi:hypothetical protein